MAIKKTVSSGFVSIVKFHGQLSNHCFPRDSEKEVTWHVFVECINKVQTATEVPVPCVKGKITHAEITSMQQR